MTVVFDATALIAILRGERGADEAAVAGLDGGAVTAVNFAEARDSLVRSLPEMSDVGAAVDRFVDRGLSILSCDRSLAVRAATLRSEHYRRRGRAVSLADCFAIAAAEDRGVPLVTSDRDQATVARAVGVEVRAIPNSAGLLPDGP